MAASAAVRAGLAALLLAASASCSSPGVDNAGPTATVRTEPPTTATTNPYAVPPVIDAAYVNRVLAGLDAVIGDVTRIVIRTKTLPPEAYDRLRAIYGTNDLLQLMVDSIQSDIRRGLSGYRADPGNKTSIVTRMISSSAECVFAQVQRDYSAVSVNPNTINPQWIALRQAATGPASAAYNPTPWTLVYDGFPQDRSTPANPCTAL